MERRLPHNESNRLLQDELLGRVDHGVDAIKLGEKVTVGTMVDMQTLTAQAAAAVAESVTKELASRGRSDSSRVHQSEAPSHRLSSRQEANSQLRVQTMDISCEPLRIVESPENQSIRSSTTSKIDDQIPGVPPISPHHDTHPSSTLKDRLPSFRQLTGQLSELAEAAATQDVRGPPPYTHHPSQSFGSATSLSPRLTFHSPFAQNSQSSPVANYMSMTTRSPSGHNSDAHGFGSPSQQAPPTSFFAQRRTSMVGDTPPSLPPQLKSVSSTDSHGQSSVESYSTTRTTPIDASLSSDGVQRPILPPPLGMPPGSTLVNIGFRCDYPDCAAPPFQTQYLLSSHKNVHSQNRPHYCPVKDCPRSEGGKGFKRKNEMIRHGLVHNSPGYICPFCPDREHKYPRPDNLQRHVRVHHVDRDKDDPMLREVLAQRAEGTGKTRRRRTMTGSSSSGAPIVEFREGSTSAYDQSIG